MAKEVNDLYHENHKTLMKEIEDKNKGKVIPGSQFERLNNKMPILSKTIYRFCEISMKFPMAFFK